MIGENCPSHSFCSRDIGRGNPEIRIYKLKVDKFFDTLRFELPEGVSQTAVRDAALEQEINLFYCNCGCGKVSGVVNGRED